MLTTANAARIPLADGMVHACVTSPPYYRQRRYGVICDWPAATFRPSPHLSEHWLVEPWRGEMGWEPHVLDYIGHLVLVYREVFRVLREDGQNWINIGDKRTNGREWFRVPEMLVDALAADGWRHEDTVIWHKASAMPGSQQNRFTRDFEYIYRLNKSRNDFFDIDAVREKTGNETSWEEYAKLLGHDWANDDLDAEQGRGRGLTAPGTKRGVPSVTHPAGRTRRTVWTVNPEGLNLPHYAAYPRELVRIMLKASVSQKGACPVCKAAWGRVVEKSQSSWEARKAAGHRGGRGGSIKLQKAAGGTHDFDNTAGGFGTPAVSCTVAWRPTCTCQGSPTRGLVRCGKCRGTGREQTYPRGTEGYRQVTPGRATIGGLQRDHDGREFAPPVETGAPCPHCNGGTIEGDVWPADVDTWPVSASVVLDPFVGSGTTAVVCQELRQKGTPVVCVGLDLNHHYLADLARERLGLLALEAWEGGRDEDNGRGLEGLPLFRALEVVGDG